MSIPGIIIAGTHSGAGKTTISTGVMAALAKRGLKVQPFKVGPDYIDPAYHTFITGNHSRNLDCWMLEEETVRHLFNKNCVGRDIAVIEGVMGLYDGHGGNTSTGSTAHIAKITGCPVVLMASGEGISYSIGALVQGYRLFDPAVNLAGVILNNVKSEGHFALLKDNIESSTGVRVLGFMPPVNGASLPSRHLGLVPSCEIEGLREKISLIANAVEKHIDLDSLMELAGRAACGAGTAVGAGVTIGTADAVSAAGAGLTTGAVDSAEFLRRKFPFACEIKIQIEERKKPLIGVAMDKAFNFYYRDSLELLEELGAGLVYFSPVDDGALPEGISGLYFGGGFPEVFAKELQINTGMKESVKKAALGGMPVFAECGGLMYLSEGIKTLEGEFFSMAGVIPGICEMAPSLQRFGYVEVNILEDCVIAGRGEKIRAHEFHHSDIRLNDSVQAYTMDEKAEVLYCYEVVKSRRGSADKRWNCGYKVCNVLAGYAHMHLWSNPSFAAKFVKSCAEYGRQL